jgi:hypothetical protein
MTLCGGSFYLLQTKAMVHGGSWGHVFQTKILASRRLGDHIENRDSHVNDLRSGKSTNSDELVLFVNGAYRGKTAELVRHACQ